MLNKSFILFKITIEKTPLYFFSKMAPALIAKSLQGVKLIIIVRDPTTRLISDFTHHREIKHKLYKQPFEKLVFTNGSVNPE